MIALRRHEPSDAARMAELLNDETISAFTSDRVPYPFTLEDAEKRIQQGRDARSRTSFVITYNDELVGEIGVHAKVDIEQYTGVVGYWIGAPYHVCHHHYYDGRHHHHQFVINDDTRGDRLV